jgi:hypothetical protein
LLGRPYSLNGISDVEGFVARIIQRSGIQPPPPWTEEDFLADLVGYVYEISLEYQPGPASFASWAGVKVRRETVNWIRRRRGRTIWRGKHLITEGNPEGVYERKLPEFVSLDAGLGNAEPKGTGNGQVDCIPDLARLLAAGSRARAGDFDALGLDPPRRTR